MEHIDHRKRSLKFFELNSLSGDIFSSLLQGRLQGWREGDEQFYSIWSEIKTNTFWGLKDPKAQSLGPEVGIKYKIEPWGER